MNRKNNIMPEMRASAAGPFENRGAKTLCRIALAAIAIGTFSAPLRSQEPSLPRQTETVLDQPFAQFDDSLTRVADILDASITEYTATANERAIAYEVPSESPATHHDGQWQSLWDQGSLKAAAARLELIRPAVETILKSHGVPSGLAAVILVESGGRPTALSSKGALGLWQLMPDTARRYGLRVDAVQDDRLDTLTATDAAARYLHDLYAQFGDWKLALAAYNAGEANVTSAILRAHTQDFDQLASLRMLPNETLVYVPKVLANVNYDRQPWAVRKGYRPTKLAIVFAVSSR